MKVFLRGFSLDINSLEGHMSKKDEQGIADLEKRLSSACFELSRILQTSKIFHRECLLSAFSLTPTAQLFEDIRECAPRAQLEETENPETSELASNFSHMKNKDFDTICEEFEESLKKLKEQEANIGVNGDSVACTSHQDGLLSIQGSVLTKKKSYNPLAEPLTPFDLSDLGIPLSVASDLIVAISACRWHMLSWVLEWPLLEERCQNLLKNPAIKYPGEELKYLVIDYTMFDEWSSEDELDTSTGIERGYEHMEDDSESEP